MKSVYLFERNGADDNREVQITKVGLCAAFTINELTSCGKSVKHTISYLSFY